MEKEPNNEGVNKDLKEARTALMKNESAPAKSESKEVSKEGDNQKKKDEDKKKFVRVAIEEDSEEEDDEPKIEEVGKENSSGIESIYPLRTAREIEAHNREA